VAAGWLVAALTGAGAGAAAGGLLGALTQAGLGEEHANVYAEGVRRGGTLLIVTCSDDKAQLAYDILGRHGSIDLDERMGQWKQSGWTGFGSSSGSNLSSGTTGMSGTTSNYGGTTGASAANLAGTTGTTHASSANLGTTGTTNLKSTTRTETTNLGAGRETEKVIPVVEEELKVGKREVQKGGVRLYSHVVETPVQENVHLREERVHVERRPVDRPIGATDVAAFKDQTIEMREKAEEAVVSKKARVIEEVVIGKEVTGHTETVRDTVRRTDVQVENLGATNVATSGVRWEDFDTDFRTHYKGLNLSDTTYDQYTPVYRYGYSLGTNDQYRSGDWNTIEPHARTHWESKNPGTWNQFKDSIRYAWDRVRSRR